MGGGTAGGLYRHQTSFYPQALLLFLKEEPPLFFYVQRLIIRKR